MRIEVTGRNVRVSDRLREQIETKLEKYEKYFQSDVTVHVALSHVKHFQIIEITIPLKNDVFFRVEESSFDMYQSIDKAVDKLDKQFKKHKTNIKKRFKTHESIRFEEIPESGESFEIENQIERSKSFPVKPMDPEEAVLQMEMLGHNFYVFLNGETEEVNVVYQRRNGGYGLIEPQIG